MQLLDNHIVDDHPMLAVLNGLARNQQYMTESFDSFKEEIKRSLDKVLEDNNVMKQELFILRQMTHSKPLQQKPDSRQNQTKTPSAPSPKSKVSEPKVPEPKVSEPKVSDPKVSKPKKTSSTVQDGQMGPSKQKQLLIIGDSISSNIDIDVIEKAVKGKVRATKAYAATFDNVGTHSKAPARFPIKKNFTDVIPAEIKKEPVDYLNLQSGSVDITNLNTKDNPKEQSEYFKKEVRYAAKKLFDAAENALSVQPSLKKVVKFKI